MMSRTRLLVLLAALVTAGVTARLGLWQLDRAAQKTALQTALETRRHQPWLTSKDLPADAASLAGALHRRIQLQGVWLPEHTIYLENRQMQGRPGFFVVTPLALSDGTAVLVQRGWLPRDLRDRTRVKAPASPAGPVLLQARIALPPARLYDFEGASGGPIRQNLELSSFALETRLKLRPLSLLELDTVAPASGQAPDPERLLRDWPWPAADVHKHHGYAFQWFALSVLTIALYVWFQILRPRRQAARAHDPAR